MRAIILATALISATVAPAATLRVPSQYPTIQAGLDAAAFGDSVLVAPGTYSDYESRLVNGATRSACAFLADGVVLLSESGPSVTTIDMQGATPFQPDVVLARSLPSTTTTIEGFTVTGGPVGASGVDASLSGKVTVRNCVFRDLDNPGAAGGVFADKPGSLDVIDCEFVRCYSNSGGGIRAYSTTVFVTGCVFQGCNQKAVQLSGLPGLTGYGMVTDCEFLGNADRALGADALWGALTVSGCWFEGNVDDGVGGAAISTGAKGPVLVEDNVFLRNSATGTTGIGGAIQTGGATNVTIQRNTFYGNSQVYTGTGGSALGLFKNGSVVQNNLFVLSTGSQAISSYGVTVTLGCNVFWQNPEGNCDTCTLTPTDRIVDPAFCDAASDDFTLAQDSPALPAYSNGCGQIGAFGQGCGAVSVETRSWGRIKSGYR